MAAAEPQAVALNDLRPATLGDDALELRDRLLGVLHRRRRQCRQRRLRHLDGARAGVEALAEILALVLVDQRFERRILAERSRRRDAAASERARARHACATARM